jgi:hypothetical protein
VPAATLRILARNVESDGFRPTAADPFSPRKIRLSDFSVELLDKPSKINYAQEFFIEPMVDECIIERDYQSIPPAPVSEDYGEFGGIAWDAEDLLLLLRLFRPGDLAFASVSMQKPDKPAQRLFPYRVISCLVPGCSTRPFVLNKSDIPEWEEFAASLKATPSWRSKWFEISRRYFLYGGSTEFNATFASEVDRVMDYTTALEAALVPESDFVSRSLRERAVKVLGLSGDEASRVTSLLKDFYSIRSTLVHGSGLSQGQLSLLQNRDRWWEFEQIVRDLIIAALRNVPAQDAARKPYLAGLYEPSDADRTQRLADDFRAVRDPKAKRELLCKLLGEL